jgi:Bacterial low temperature requirement A protein (LtrA)
VQHELVAVGIGEERHVADPGVEGLAEELDALGLERRARRGDVVAAQRPRVALLRDERPALPLAPGAGANDSAVFVVAYAALFALLAALYARAWRQAPAMRALSGRDAAADAAGAAVWLASLGLDDDRRPVAWAAAMLILMGGPVLAAASTDVLSYDPDHIAERYGLFTLIVLGESAVAEVAGLDTAGEPSARREPVGHRGGRSPRQPATASTTLPRRPGSRLRANASRADVSGYTSTGGGRSSPVSARLAIDRS